jgi:hypothetical protein
MNTYSLEVKVCLDVDAPSVQDAKQVVEDLLGPGEMEDFNVNITSFDIAEV